MHDHPQLSGLRRVREDLSSLAGAAQANGDLEVAKTIEAAMVMVDWAIHNTQIYRCPRCGAISHNPNDRRHHYCARCKRFE